ncbi:PREDICTED: uncharacterized protein LOC105564643 [Vollenhovia emeryi]|uniref:uncharacterized protein LOC105564643 n=1 Tax=Vollenhovia emeryi TaxID=411798 RepID=UPI0005F5738E|nr:PREDICTED: uncharacterized protein LOC105564643 [Vollenhovia emeryi]
MMKTCRKLVAMVLLLLIHLLTLQIGDAGRDHTNVSAARSEPKIILEEVIVAGSGNNTRVIANAVAEDAAGLDGEMLSLLSKRELRRSGRSNSDRDDQDAAQSGDALVNANEEDDLEVMSRVIAKYEPQRLTSRKTKRKIVDGSNSTDDAGDKVAGSITDLERTYAEILRNISRQAPELSANNADANPYLSQAAKQLRQIYIPEVTIRPATSDGAEKSHSGIDSSPASPVLSKKSTRLPKKYSKLNRTAPAPRFSSAEEAESDEKSAGALKVSNRKTKPRNGSLAVPTSVHSGPTEKLKDRREWNAHDSIRAKSQFPARLNNSDSDNVINVNNLKSLNVPNYVQSPPRYNVVPRPFSVLQSPNSLVGANVDAPYRRPSSSPTGFKHQQQLARSSSANVLPLVLPTELFNPPSARRYVPIKRANHLNLEGNPATSVSTEASPPTSSVGEKTTLADYDAVYKAIIGTTRSSLADINSQRGYGSSDYYAITESPTERAVTRTSLAATYAPGQTSASYAEVERQKDAKGVRKHDFLPGIASYNSPGSDGKLNESPGIALYNKFASLYTTGIPNVFNAPKAITQDFKQPVQPSQQQVSALPYATLKPLTPTLLQVRPIAASKSAPHYDSRLLVSQDGKYDASNDKNDKPNEHVKGADVTEEEDDDDDGDYKTQINREAHKIYKTWNKPREKEDRVEEREDRSSQQSRNHQDKDEHYRYDEDDKSSRNNDRREKHGNARHETDDADEEEVDETKEDEYVDTEKGGDEDDNDPRHRYTKYDRENSNEEQREKLSYDRKKYNKPKDRRDKHGSDVVGRFESNKRYFEAQYNNDDDETRGKEYDRTDKKKLVGDKQYGRDRQGREYEEPDDESVAEDKPFTQRFKDQRAYRRDEEDEEEQSDDGDKRKHHYQVSPRRDSLRKGLAREEYGESNPTQTREEYHRQRVKNEHRDRPGNDGNQDDGEDDHVHGETQEHAHKHEEHHEKKKGGDHHFEKGGGAEHEEEHHGHEGEKGEKGYKVWHEHEKAEKGHHDKEQGSKHYDEKAGEEKKHEEEGGYHEEHHHGDAGKKTAEFGEKGEHKKGHSTHGEHSVHKKDEFEKKTEFFDEFNEDGGAEKHGEHHHDHESKKGGHEKKGHHDSGDHEEKYGKEEKHEKGGHHHEHKGHKVDEGHDHHYDHDQKYGKKEGHEHGKKWSFKKGDGGGDHKHNR